MFDEGIPEDPNPEDLLQAGIVKGFSPYNKEG
jgi:hypothetical protein